MTVFSANPVLAVFMIIALLGVVGYFAYNAYDSVGIETSAAEGVVTSKQYNPPGTTYNQVIAGGRAWSQAQETPETYAVSLTVGGEPTAGLVSKALFDTLSVGDKVHVKVRRTRSSKRLEAVEVTR